MNAKKNKNDDGLIKSAAEIALENAEKINHEDDVEDAQMTKKEKQDGNLSPDEESFKEKYMRVRADLENIQRRTREERETMRLNTLTNFLRELLPFIDNMQRALQAAESDESELAHGLRMNWDVLKKILKDNNVEKIPTEEGFNPEMHEALMQVSDDSVPDGTIKTVIEDGYRIGERVIRYSKVQVTTGGPSQNSDSEEDNQKSQESGNGDH